MFKNLLLPNDGSAFSALATPLAINLATAFDAKLHVVRVHFSAPGIPDEIASFNLDETVRDLEKEELGAVVEQALAAGIPTTGELLEGPAAPALERYIEAEAIDLVIMSTHGRGGIARTLIGSVAEGLVRRTTIPVLLLHAHSDEDAVRTDLFNLDRILVSLDGSPEAEAVMPYATAIARQFNADMVLTQVAVPVFEVASAVVPGALYENDETISTRAGEYLQEVAARHTAASPMRWRVLNASTVAEGILRCAHEENAGLIAMSTHGRRGLSRLALGSVAESVIRHSEIPVLLLPHPEPES